tara:strand:- start:1001 stop:2191 length:1191 start_codon:yes stop_codon:yes gene_type:complete
MAYDLLNTARNQSASFGSAIANLEQNAIDDKNSNLQASEIFKQTVNQTLTDSRIQGPISIAFGGYELAKQVPELVGRLKAAAAKAKELPSELGDIAKTTAGKLQGRVQEGQELLGVAKDTITSTLGEIQTKVGDLTTQVGETAGEMVGNITSKLGALQTQAGETAGEMVGNVTSKLSDISLPELPSLADTGSSFFSKLGLFGGGVKNTLIPATDAQNMIMDLDPESLGAGARGFITGGRNLPSISGLGEQLSGASNAAAGSVLDAAKQAGSGVITSLSQAGEEGLSAARGALSDVSSSVGDIASGIAGKTVSAAGELASAGGDIIKGGIADLAEGAGEAALAAVPVVGEVAAIGFAGYQLYEGFKDLFTHPKPMAAPTPIAIPTIANISQSFQSGV